MCLRKISEAKLTAARRAPLCNLPGLRTIAGIPTAPGVAQPPCTLRKLM